MDQRTNITDIASKSGFSITTVSRVINGQAKKYRISTATQEKIQTIANDLNYKPNEFARNLRMGHSKTIALIIPSLKNPFFSEIASIANQEIKKYDYITLIGDSNESIETEVREVSQFSAKNIDGLIIIPCGNNYEHIEQTIKEGIPVVCIDRYFEELNISYVSSDNFEGAYSATEYLIKQGHKFITCIQGVTHSTPNKQRVAGFIKALSDHNINNYKVTGDDFSEQNGYIETKLLLQQKNRPSAIFAFSNTIAMGCLKAFKEENIKLPNDISLITFDDNPFLDYIDPPLTCISQPIDDICKIAVKILFSNILNKDNSTSQVLLKTTLKVKDSVKNLLI
jgi:LacI family transcriptional regulator